MDINFSDILLDETLHENVSVYYISTDPQALRTRFDKIDGLRFVVMNLDIFYYLIMDCLMKFVLKLNILLVEKLVLKIVLIIILEKSELIHVSLYILKKYLLFML